jgi:DNA-binding transcriptional regulator LsrR (DeoR family)
MSSLEQSERKLLDLIAEFADLVKVQEENSFEDVWNLTNQICDRYQLGMAQVIEFPREMAQVIEFPREVELAQAA